MNNLNNKENGTTTDLFAHGNAPFGKIGNHYFTSVRRLAVVVDALNLEKA